MGTKVHADMLNVQGASKFIYLQAGEANGQQESNEDRSMVVGSSTRKHVDEPSGLGGYCTTGCGGDTGSVNVALPGFDGVRSAGGGFIYQIWVV